ncbi:MAG: nitroreductase family protein [Cloacibacillus sp.]
MNELRVDEGKCTKCGLCVRLCPTQIIKFGDFGFPEMDERRKNRCIECGQCVLFCPACANDLSFMEKERLVKVADIKMPTDEEAQDLLRTRRSIRQFDERPLSRDELHRIFETVRQAPTAVNEQPVRWIVSDSPDKTKEITNLVLCWLREEIFKDPTSPQALLGASMIAHAKEGRDLLLRGAPHAAIAVVPKSHRWPEDGVIALTYFELSAHGMGVGCCWGGYLTTAIRNFKGLREYLGIGEDEHVCGAQMFGWPKIRPSRQYAPRRDVKIDWVK